MRQIQGYPIPLTPDERRVLDELALGHTDEAAAARLGTSRRTLRRRVRDAMDKLGARSRFQAGVLYAQSGAHLGHAPTQDATRPHRTDVLEANEAER